MVDPENGLILDAQNHPAACTKGDLMDRYEFSAQLAFLDTQEHRKAGVFPVYIDPQNYLSAELDPATLRLSVSGKRNGEAIPPMEKNLAGWKRLYPATTQEMHLKRPGWISSMKLRFANRPPQNLALRYRDTKGNWKKLEGLVRDGAILKFTPVETDAFRVKSKGGDIARAQAWVEGAPSVNIRSVKLRDKVLIIIDGKQELEIPGAWPKSQVGFTAENGKAAFNGITCFEIP